MPKHIIRKDLSALGFFLVLYVLLVNLVAAVIMGVVMVIELIAGYLGPNHALLWGIHQQTARASLADSTWFVLMLNAVSQYLIGMPIVARMIKRRLPTIAVRQYLPAYYELERENAAEVRDSGEEAFRPRDVLAIVPIIVFLMVAGSAIGSGIAMLLGDAAGVEAQNAQVELLLSGNLWATVLFVVILAPVAEELFFRKLLIDQVSPLGRRGAVLTSALCFGFFHQNLYQIFYAVFLGALFAVIYLKTEKIIYTILLHMGVNFFGGIVLPYFTEGLNELALLSPEEIMNALAKSPGALVFLVLYELLALVGLVLFFVYLAKGKFRLTERLGTASRSSFAAAFFTAPGQIVFMLVCVGMAIFSLVRGVG